MNASHSIISNWCDECNGPNTIAYALSSCHQNVSTLNSRLACKCAELAKARGHQVFALQFYGECWSGKDAVYLFARDGLAHEQDCVGIDYAKCDNNAETECVGKAFRNYVYKLKEGKKYFSFIVVEFINFVYVIADDELLVRIN